MGFGDFFSSLFTGSNPGLEQAKNTAQSLTGFTQGVGERGLTDASKYYHDILSDPTQAIAPEVSAGQEQTQQAKNNMAEFGTRSGGTAAASAAADAANRANLINLIAKLRSGAAAGQAGIGSSATSQSIAANNDVAYMSQQELQNMLNSILGGVTTAGVNYGLGKVGL